MRRVLAYCILMSLSAAAYAQLVLLFEVQAQSLADALRVVATQTNTNILYDPSLVAGRQVEAQKIQSTLDNALAQLLDGTGLQHQYVNEKTLTLVRREAHLIPASSAIEPTEMPMTSTVNRIATSRAR